LDKIVKDKFGKFSDKYPSGPGYSYAVAFTGLPLRDLSYMLEPRTEVLKKDDKTADQVLFQVRVQSKTPKLILEEVLRAVKENGRWKVLMPGPIDLDEGIKNGIQTKQRKAKTWNVEAITQNNKAAVKSHQGIKAHLEAMAKNVKEGKYKDL